MLNRYAFTIICMATLLQAGTASALSVTMITDWTAEKVTNSVESTSDFTSSSFKDDKVVQEARDDAACFVASNGEQRGVRLEAALEHIRNLAPQLAQASDLQLAQAILTI
ncbi:DUF2388 domain-containing protein [Azomonas macrocytogenes]|uniref:Uncharacterized protein (TIGR02448 family) n=1 Tax=Azomonas macrocytogenes TaxID=69962 RepID=A0A839T8P5_AZOMA|nr:DUF2388 domain-containing protein [Azomonas macrocytogenes]MBB3104013.1 uncharacterized protein (TIGR02448 family) [Azomonas macrocytogenes]